jgi:hypothetical protein
MQTSDHVGTEFYILVELVEASLVDAVEVVDEEPLHEIMLADDGRSASTTDEAIGCTGLSGPQRTEC